MPPVKPPHHPEVNKGHDISGGREDISRMRIGVEEPVIKDLAQHAVYAAVGENAPVKSFLLQAAEFAHPDALDLFQGQYPFGGEIRIAPHDVHTGIAPE